MNNHHCIHLLVTLIIGFLLGCGIINIIQLLIEMFKSA